MKVIFLDIDGVLNCRSTKNPRKLPYVVDRKLLARFHRLLDHTGAKVVLSSTWRYDPAGVFSAKYYGIPLMGCTPDKPHQSRSKEIVAWLRDHPRVKRFAILDDEDDELDGFPLFQPSAGVGLTTKMADGLVRFLNGETDTDMRNGRVTRILENARAVLVGHKG